MAILQKILNIQSTLRAEKTGWDERQEYAYWKADDIARSVKEKMNEEGIIHRTSIIEWAEDNKWDQNGRNRPRVTFKAGVTFVDVEDGSEFTTEVVATGADTGGDKATRKAQIQAFKIAIVDLFIITEESEKFDSDGDAESEPINMTPPPPKAATVAELVAKVAEYVKNDDHPLTGANVNSMGMRIAKENGVSEEAREWKKSDTVLTLLLQAIENGEVE